jgi:hypothetical protein
MKIKSRKPAPFRELVTKIRPLAEQWQALNNRAKALGLFADDRELLACPRCGLEEDVSSTGQLLTCREASVGLDTGLSFQPTGKKRFRCSSCGQIVHEPIPEHHQTTNTLTPLAAKRIAARIATDRRKLEARCNHDHETSRQARP